MQVLRGASPSLLHRRDCKSAGLSQSYQLSDLPCVGTVGRRCTALQTHRYLQDLTRHSTPAVHASMAGKSHTPSSIPAPNSAQCIIVMGVCGCGKSTFGRKLADVYGCNFIDADEYHPAANVDKMRRGIPLDDNDRRPWLRELASIIHSHLANGKRLVMGCSALKEAYRDILRGRHPDAVLFVLLQPSREELLRRLQARTKVGGHFMPASLLDSQLATLEPHGRDLIALEGDGDTEEILTSFWSSAKIQ